MIQPKRLRLLFVLLTVLTLLSYNFGCDSNSQDTDALVAKSEHNNLSREPRFVLKDLEGNDVSSQEFVGKITILNFWTTWCRFCRIEIPHLNELYKKYKDQGVEIIGISFDSRGAADVIPFIKRVPMDYPILIGTRSMGNSFGGIVGFPTTIVIDREWRIYQRYPGLTDKGTLEHDITQLLARD